MKKFGFMAAASVVVALASCSEEPEIPTGDQQGDPIPSTDYASLYVMSEGSWGQSNARIDRLDLESGQYFENVFAVANESAVLSLGDVCNDLELYGNRLYAVVNGSHKVEVMDAKTLKSYGKIDVSSPREIAFSGTKGYVTSWIDGANDNGSVIEFDLNTLEVTHTVSVGQEPEGIAVSGGKVYVACSGGMHYNTTGYVDELWALNVSDLSVSEILHVAPNLHRLQADTDGSLWVNSRGDYAANPSGLYHIVGSQVTSMGVPCAGFALGEDKIYYYGSEYSLATGEYTTTYGTIDRATMTPGASFITDGSDANIAAPYGVFAAEGRIYVTDAKNYASSGSLHVYGSDGELQQTFTAGICPAAVVFVPKNL